jgi:signal transduction histidine kinase
MTSFIAFFFDVFDNYLSNDIKFTNPNGTISIKQTSDAKKVYVQITDTGCGMPSCCGSWISSKAPALSRVRLAKARR